jgi:hypothetical protein
MRVRASSQGFDAQLNHAMKHPDSAGNHGGEAMLTSKSTFSIPIDPTVLKNASDINDEPCRFAAVEVRFGQMSILNISSYFWCGEGFGGRTWAILQQLSTLVKSFKIPFIIYADFNFAPEVLEASGWLNEHSAAMSIPNVQSTCKGSKQVIDYCIISRSIAPFFTLEVVDVPWGPHLGLKGCLEQFPTSTFVTNLLSPSPCPWTFFMKNGNACLPCTRIHA